MDVLEKALIETLMAVMDSVWSEQVASENLVENEDNFAEPTVKS